MKSKSTFSITTLGCKVNQCESDAINRALKTKGIAVNADNKKPDICIVNTCTVTQKASMQSRQAIRKAIKSFPKAKIVVTGCYAQTAPEELAKIEGVTAVISNADKPNLPELLAQLNTAQRTTPSIVHHKISEQKNFALSTVSAYSTRSRPFLKIQDGCNAFCTYCIVPYARGRSRSMPFDDVLAELKKLENAGFCEVVLTGIHLGCYGQDLSPPVTLLQLLEAINRRPPVKRIRLSSIEPMELSTEIIALVKISKTFCHHFHLPLQSGDNDILKRMKRPYLRENFRQKVIEIDRLIPDAAIGADILVGFPGESETAFENTLELIHSIPISYLHVFPFSPRKNTPAFHFAGKIPERVIKERCKILRELGKIKKKQFYARQVGKIVTVLVEGSRDRTTNSLKGVSDNYLPVYINGDDTIKSSLVKVRITGVTPELKVLGEIQER
ncbi:MAG: tRNA (N(6)-L-threonylcarbamoyladenosine(37)-C(2))-methylthiotransferase MtaB [Desulfobacteraceae bacterium]|jgi:threonylcarbamoyladenosine tRNA methylthiotransferase MtaB